MGDWRKLGLLHAEPEEGGIVGRRERDSQGRIDLLDHLPLAREWRALERRPRAGGTDRVDHPRGGHDDHANAVALAAPSGFMRRSSQ